jgi:RNA polymerase sigma factor (sigma-70 family)
VEGFRRVGQILLEGTVMSQTQANTVDINRVILPPLIGKPQQMRGKKSHPNLGPERVPEPQFLAARGGDSPSFESLYAPHKARLFSTALKITGNREDAEDAVQDSLMRAFVNMNDFRGASTFSTWLTRIVINSALMIRRKNRAARYIFIDDTSPAGEGRFKFEIPHSAPDPAQTFFIKERTKAVRKAISRLRPNLRSVVEVGQLKEIPMREVAKVLNITIAAAKGRLLHARTALRRSAALRAVVQSRKQPAA